MDILLACSSPNIDKVFNSYNSIVKNSISDVDFTPDNSGGYINRWLSGSGESRYYKFPSCEIWFDGYVYLSGEQLASDVFLTLAERITKGKEILKGDDSGIFNMLVREISTGSIYLANDPSGLLPLYYSHQGNDFFVSTHLYILAKALNCKPDLVQVVAKQALGYAIGKHTYFEDIKRLNPGELVYFDSESNQILNRYTEVYFTGYHENFRDLSDATYNSLENATRHIGTEKRIGVMLSEGFDSRLIAALLKKNKHSLCSYTHGTFGTKGTKITEKVAENLGLTHKFEEVILPTRTDSLRNQLLLTDHLILPYWHSGSKYFQSLDMDFVTTGYELDSLIGAHIFYPHTNKGSRIILQKYSEILRQNLNLISDDYIEKLANEIITQTIDVDTSKISRWLKGSFVPEISEVLLPRIEDFKECIIDEFSRFSDTGSHLPSLKVQRFWMEDRAKRFVFSQELTLRKYNKIFIPSYDRNFVKFVSGIPVKYKLNHSLYLQIIRKYLPDAFSVPTGNYGISLKLPRILLETNRFLGIARDLKIEKRFLKSKGTSNYNNWRAVFFSEKSGHKNEDFRSLEEIIRRNDTVLNHNSYMRFLKEIEVYQRKGFDFASIYQAAEFCQIFAHMF